MGKECRTYDQLPDLLIIDELAEYMRCGVEAAREESHRPGFPRRIHGKTHVFPKRLVREWFDRESTAEARMRENKVKRYGAI